MSGLQINLVLEAHSGLNPTCFCSLKEHLNIEASPPLPREKWNIPLVGNQGIPDRFPNEIYVLGIFAEGIVGFVPLQLPYLLQH